MKYDSDKHKRRSIRLKWYDYSQNGAYFITICTQKRACLLGEIQSNTMILNEMGTIVSDTWYDLPNHNSHVLLDEFVIMPNHIHGIVMMANNTHQLSVGAGSEPPSSEGRPAPTRHGLSEIVRQLKTFSSTRINKLRNSPGIPVWQRNYYEHVIRNEKSLHAIREYIRYNSLNWISDKDNPENIQNNNTVGAGSEPAPTILHTTINSHSH
jgi:REP element-mobilizing transposase RayT